MRRIEESECEIDGSVEIVRRGSSSLVCFTCEHASEEFPAPWTLPAQDSWLGGTHWTHDLGARDLVNDLCERFSTVAVLARFSRLLADPNRPTESNDLFRKTAEGRPIQLNHDIDSTDRARRLLLWGAYHAALDREVGRSPARVVLAVHTFTPLYEGNARPMEIGVLFDEEEALATDIAKSLAAAGFRVAMNEPYSGKDGLMYSVDRHARRHDRHALELEVRQDLAVVASARERIAEATARALGDRFRD
jgi:predicted N-formylglutamate amidohydrolase